MSGESYPLSAPPSPKSFPVHFLWRGRGEGPDFQWPLEMQLLHPLGEATSTAPLICGVLPAAVLLAVVFPDAVSVVLQGG